ncbi:MAG: extracellular solute-binding protein [Acetoanaerobium sp.]|nr:extracellular solute-binding protein [Acetoanaerobium sp.]MBP9499811.1 extracellular solute-binding protein [Acetoanaerobium sp.]
MKKIFMILLMATMVFTFAGCASDTKTTTLNVYNWGDYIDPEVIKDFESEFDIKINYEEFATNEEMLAKIQAGGTSYDVIFPSEYMVESMIQRGLLHELDFSKLENMKNIGGQYQNLEYDKDQKYSVPYLWGTMGIVYNKTKVSDPVDSWDILWNPKYEGQIIMLDSPRDTIGITLKKLGYSLNTKNPAELEEAKQALIEQKKLVRSYEVDTYKGQMIAGEAAMSLAWSGDAMLLMSENEDLAYAIPKEGTNLWFDCMAIPTTAAHKEEAEIFINFMMRPDIAARNSEYIKYSTPNEAALELLPEEEVNNEYLYPKGDLNKLGEVFTDLGEFTTEYDRVWTEIKSY